jgi:hypothetical protein
MLFVHKTTHKITFFEEKPKQIKENQRKTIDKQAKMW